MLVLIGAKCNILLQYLISKQDAVDRSTYQACPTYDCEDVDDAILVKDGEDELIAPQLSSPVKTTLFVTLSLILLITIIYASQLDSSTVTTDLAFINKCDNYELINDAIPYLVPVSTETAPPVVALTDYLYWRTESLSFL